MSARVCSCDRERADQPHVRLGVTDPHRRDQHPVQRRCDRSSDVVGEDRVRAQREVGALVLDRAERDHRGPDAALEQIRERGRAQPLELMHGSR